ncbi:hypothetical protein C8F01DRAFT_1363901 [Mycena amicta]|nr:hypothetical protein C8F01DRAFT_1363901 [Mycena amicta]
MVLLPAELIQLVLGQAFYKSLQTNRPDYQCLSTCALVAKSWSLPAQILLYRCITIEASEPFLCATHNPSLLAYVRSFSLILTAETSSEAIPRLFNWCPALYELGVGARIFSLSKSDLADVASHIASTGVKIRALNLIECSTQSPILFQLLSLLPAVEFLTLGVEIMDVPPEWTMPCTLYELKCHRMPAAHVLNKLLGPSLQILELRDPPSAYTALELAPYCAKMKSLRLMRFNAHCSTIIAQCTSLVEIVLFNVPTLVSLPTLPASLEHLAIIIQTYTTSVNSRPILRAVDALPRLRLLTYVGDYLPELQALCEAKRVPFSWTPQKHWINDDPVKTIRFPRRRSVSNFYLMN